MKLGRMLRRERVKAALSLAQLAESCGVSKSHLSRIENGDTSRVPSEPLLHGLASALAIPPDALFVAAGRVPADVTAFILATPGLLDRLRKQMTKRGHE